MKRSAFTLVELIFTIVIIGVLAAVAIPKFKNLKQNAQTANIVKYYSDIRDTAKTSYMNLTELGGKTASGIDLSDLYDFNGKEWTHTDADNYTYTVILGTKSQTFKVSYDNAGKITMTTTLDSTTTGLADIKTALNSKLGMTFASDINTTILDLTDQ